MTQARLIVSVVALGALLTLSACGGYGNTSIVTSADSTPRVAGLTTTHANSAVIVPESVIVQFQQELDSALYGENGFGRGQDLKIEWGFTAFEEGSRTARYAFGGIGQAGAGKLKVRARFLNPIGKELAVIDAEGVVTGGFMGGSYGTAIDNAVDQIASFTVSRFKKE